jgi:hypothetical protein
VEITMLRYVGDELKEAVKLPTEGSRPVDGEGDSEYTFVADGHFGQSDIRRLR